MSSPLKRSESRQRPLTKSIGRLSKSQLASKKGLYKRKRVASEVKPKEDAPATKTVKVGGSKNSGERTVPVQKAPKYYPAEDVRRPRTTRKSIRPAKLRTSITPGTILILLAGKHRGKRVVFLKQLQPSGLLLVTGPHKLNGVPLRRVNQAYVIATSTKVDFAKVKIDEKFDDEYFKIPGLKRSRGTEGEFFSAGEKKRKAPNVDNDTKKSDQKTLDSEILKAIKSTEHLDKYLKSVFGLSKGQHPHLMQF